MTNVERSMIVVVVLAVAGIVAIWPRGDERSAGDVAVGSSTTRPAEDGALLAQLREQAAMRPCPSPAPDAPAPAGPLAAVTAPCLGTPGTVDLGAALAGKATLLNVWASWCVPCREEMPILAAYAVQPGAVPVLGVNVQEPAADGLAFIAEVGVRYPSIADPDGTVQEVLRVPPVLPVNYLVRPNGSAERITDPLVFRSTDDVRAAVARHLE